MQERQGFFKIMYKHRWSDNPFFYTHVFSIFGIVVAKSGSLAFVQLDCDCSLARVFRFIIVSMSTPYFAASNP